MERNPEERISGALAAGLQGPQSRTRPWQPTGTAAREQETPSQSQNPQQENDTLPSLCND